MNRIIAIFVFIIFSNSSFSQDLSGSWIGELNFGGQTLGIAFNLENNEEGLLATMDIPQQGLNKAKAQSATFIDSILTVKFPNFGIEYKGILTQTNEINGNLLQSGLTIPLNLSKGNFKLNRPQEPKTPYRYYSENISFKNSVDNITLSGTLTLPKTKGKFPVAIIISGSGPQNRDGEMFGHKPYLVLADQLTKNGIGVLRYDERGVGQSQGEYDSAGINEFSKDVESAIDYLRSRKEIDASKIGLIGHSLGGLIASKIASEDQAIAFVVLLAAPGIDGDKLMLSQKAAIERAMGFNEFQIAQAQGIVKEAYDIIRKSDLDNLSLKDSLNSYYVNKYGGFIPESQRKALINQIGSHEVTSLIKSTPSEFLEKITCPVLAINGDKDFQVSASENLPAIKTSIEKNGNMNVKTVTLKSLNHLFQESETGLISEYSEIEQTIAPVAMQLITTWISDQVK